MKRFTGHEPRDTSHLQFQVASRPVAGGRDEGIDVPSLATSSLPLATEKNEPLRITKSCGSPSGAASRDAAPGTELPATRRSCSRSVLCGTDRGGPIGVVKLLRARGGCLGVIRIRAWKAAICPGELPNERRSRNTRATQGTETSQYLEEKKSTETP